MENRRLFFSPATLFKKKFYSFFLLALFSCCFPGRASAQTTAGRPVDLKDQAPKQGDRSSPQNDGPLRSTPLEEGSKTSRREAQKSQLKEMSGRNPLVVESDPASLSSSRKIPRAVLESVLDVAKKWATQVVKASGEVKVSRGLKYGASQSVFGNPSLDLQVDRGSETKDLQILGYMYVPVDLFGQRGARLSEADAHIRYRELGLKTAQCMAINQSLEALGMVIVASQKLDLTKEAEESAKKESYYFDEKKRLQDATLYEASLAKSEEGRWVQLRVEAENQLSEALSNYVQVMGLTSLAMDPSKPEFLAGLLPDSVSIQPQTNSKEWLQDTPWLAELNAESIYWEAAQKRWKQERSIPVQFTLIGGRGDRGDLRLGGGVVLGFPLFRRNQGEIAKAEAEMQRSIDLKTSLAKQLEAKWTHASLSYERLLVALDKLEKEALPASETVVKAAEESFRRGKKDLLSVILAKRELQQAKTRRLDVVASLWKAYADMAGIMGKLP